MLKLAPMLGDFSLAGLELIQRGSGNSTRWIIQVEHARLPLHELRDERLSAQFSLYRGRERVVPSIYVFTFGPQTPEFYDARPTLQELPDGGFQLEAWNVPAKYLLSLDILHSLYR